jgi:hypothetical protein
MDKATAKEISKVRNSGIKEKDKIVEKVTDNNDKLCSTA